MTDEEKAEEYAGKMCVNCIRYYCKRQSKKNIGSIDCCNEYLFKKKHYLAGFIEGRKEEWHDLREQPSDLPKEEGAYWCCIGGGNLFFNYDVVYFSNNEWEFDTRVIAWIELPHFAGGLNVRSY